MSKIQLKPREKRIAERQVLSGLLPGRMSLDGRVVSCRPTDVSPFGMGIIASEKLKEGAILVLDTKQHLISLKIAWVKEDFSKKDLWRYGLASQNPELNIEEIFKLHGCLK